jgi:predicted phosphate transport protein (TIGR00153 family)
MASPLGRLFGKSPITPIQQHMQLAQDSVQLLCELLAASMEQDPGRRAKFRDLTLEAARKARDLRRDLREHLPRGMMLAIPRSDLLVLIEIQQEIIEGVQALTRLLSARPPARSDAVDAAIGNLCDHLAEAAGHALAAIRELDEMLEVAFTHKERGPVDLALEALRGHLARCEARQTALIETIAADEATLSAVDAMLLYRIAEGMGDIIRRCHEVGEQLELLLAR